MNDEDLILRCNVIKKVFNDNRKIIREISENERKLPSNVYQGGDLFETEDGEIISFELQIVDFNVDELVKYVELAEELYEEYETPISIYILCSKNVKIQVKECEIISEANFTIRLATSEEDIAKIILEIIKNKMNNGKKITQEDIDILKMLPMICDVKNRNYFRKEHFKIINQIS